MQTLADLLECFKVYAVCIQCARMELIDLDDLANRVGMDTPVSELRSRLRCRTCGVRRGDLRIVYVGPCERSSAFRYRR